MNGPNALTYTEIDAWVRLSGENPRPVEIQMILAMDSAWLSAMAEESRQDRLRHEGMAQARRGWRG